MASLAVALEPVSAESLAPNGFEFTGDGGEAAGVRCNDGLGTPRLGSGHSGRCVALAGGTMSS
jgi:hypothetical protein